MCIQSHDVSWILVPRATKARMTRLYRNRGRHNSPHSTCLQCPIWRRGKPDLHQERLASREGKMSILDSHEMKSTMFVKGHKVDANIELWHKRMSHINLQKLKGMQSKRVIVGLLTLIEKEIAGMCEACLFGKQHRESFPKERNISKEILDVIHSEVWGLAQTTTFSGCRYYVTFIDDFSKHTWIYPMRLINNYTIRKSEWFSSSCHSLTIVSAEFESLKVRHGLRRLYSFSSFLKGNKIYAFNAKEAP